MMHQRDVKNCRKGCWLEQRDGEESKMELHCEFEQNADADQNRSTYFTCFDNLPENKNVFLIFLYSRHNTMV